MSSYAHLNEEDSCPPSPKKSLSPRRIKTVPTDVQDVKLDSPRKPNSTNELPRVANSHFASDQEIVIPSERLKFDSNGYDPAVTPPNYPNSSLHDQDDYDEQIKDAQHRNALAALEMEDDDRETSLLRNRRNLLPSTKTICIAILLLIFGLLCVIVAIINFSVGESPWFGFFLLGILLVIPGAYHCYLFWKVWRTGEPMDFRTLGMD